MHAGTHLNLYYIIIHDDGSIILTCNACADRSMDSRINRDCGNIIASFFLSRLSHAPLVSDSLCKL